MENTHTIIELANSVAVAVKELTEYDRVMIYRFDREYNGEVIAEAKQNELPAFLGLHYPHTDIPAQARELYLKNQLRVISDVDYSAEPLYASQNSNLNNLDLSMSALRSVSPIHIEYLKNMDVGATLTVSLVHKGKLWGLIACHHQQPKFLSPSMKASVKLNGHFITSQIDVRLQNEQYEESVETKTCVEHLIAKKLDVTAKSIQDLYSDNAITGLCNGDGACALIGNEVYKFGQTPSTETLKVLGVYLHATTSSNTMHTDNLAHIIGDLPAVTIDFPGVVFHSLGNDNDCLMWFRQETIREVIWAGEPKKSAEGDALLSPRKSFAKWKQRVKDKSRPWLTTELHCAQSFCNFFQIHLRSVLLHEEKESQRKLSETLHEANAELENINWISTHDFQEPLRKIRMMSSILVDDKNTTIPDSMMSKITKIQHSAERMQNLIKAITKYTKTSKQVEHFETVDLNTTLDDLLEEINEALSNNNIKLTTEHLPTIAGVPFLLHQALSNLLNNAIKFSVQEKQSYINIETSLEQIEGANSIQPYYRISVSDNGIGFDNEYNEKIFKIFSRLHSINEYGGAGVGLAMCKKILRMHQGFITAKGELGKGSTFSMYFPKQ